LQLKFISSCLALQGADPPCQSLGKAGMSPHAKARQGRIHAIFYGL
jgi:hypothetical protein